MTCKKVSGLLADFIEGTLGAGDKTFVEQHLRTCQKCAAELASLQAYFRDMASVEEMSPPKDFLNQVHARLEKEKGVKNIVRSLFVPLHIKIPLEAAAMALVFFLLVWFVQDEISEKGMERIPLIAESPAPPISEAPREKSEPEEGGEKMERTFPEPEKRRKMGFEEMAESPETEKAAEFSVILSQDTPQYADSDISSLERKPVELSLQLYPESTSVTILGYYPTVAISGGKDSKTLPSASRDVEGMAEADKIEEEEQAVESRMHQKKGRGTSQPPDIFERIHRITLELGGEVIHADDEDAPDEDPFITVELPAENYPSFLIELHALGDLQEPPPGIEDKGTSVLLRIRLQDASLNPSDSNRGDPPDSSEPAPAKTD